MFDNSADHVMLRPGKTDASRLEEPEREKAPVVFRKTLGSLVSGHCGSTRSSAEVVCRDRVRFYM